MQGHSASCAVRPLPVGPRRHAHRRPDQRNGRARHAHSPGILGLVRRLRKRPASARRALLSGRAGAAAKKLRLGLGPAACFPSRLSHKSRRPRLCTQPVGSSTVADAQTPAQWEFGAEFASQDDAASPCAAKLRNLTNICHSLASKRSRRVVAIIALYALSLLSGRPGALLRPAPLDGICMLPRIRLKQALMARGRCAVP